MTFLKHICKFSYVILITFLSSLIPAFTYATHNRAGDITYEEISYLYYKVTITTFTYAPSPADRCELGINWGDGTVDTLQRNNGKWQLSPNGSYCFYGVMLTGPFLNEEIKMNTYTGFHTYPGPGTYTIWMEDPNRNGGIVNIPNSVNVPFFISSLLVINPFIGKIDSPIPLNPPVDNGCVGKPFYYNPAAYDIDGDSLSYSIQPCKGDSGLFIPGYTYPETSGTFGINAITGTLTWDAPVVQGEYNVAILIKAWRHGVLVCSVILDMQILIATCEIKPPVITAIKDTCVIAGDKLQLEVTATCEGETTITLSATGGQFDIPDSATFPVFYGVGKVSSQFTWQTNCSNIQKYPWEVVFQATNNSTPVSLVAVSTLRITVIAPPIKNLTATPVGNTVELSWDSFETSAGSDGCTNNLGYKIYRSTKCVPVEVGYCTTGVPASSGYVLIGETNSPNDTTFTDNNNGAGLVHGITYGYVVISYFADGSESIVSKQVCASLIKDVPVITNISIRNTAILNGSAYIAWSKPSQLDTNKIHGPFKYLVFRSTGINNKNLNQVGTLNGLNDTTYIDTLFDTKDNALNYRIDLYTYANGNTVLVGSTTVASSVFLSIQPTNHELVLTWYVNVPWTNSRYVIYRKKPNALTYDSIGETTSQTYLQTGLKNGVRFCYYIKSVGGYSDPSFVHPIINLSEQACADAIDNTHPCAPTFAIDLECKNRQDIITWDNPNSSCSEGTNGIVKCLVFYFPTSLSKDSTLIRTVAITSNISTYSVTIDTIVGCYTIIAVDSAGNTSVRGNKICLNIDVNNSCIRFISYEGTFSNNNECIYIDKNNDTCYFYRLPNVFTPNGDGRNDYFIPFHLQYVLKFIKTIDIKIFNRWGRIVFQTNEPGIEWNGKDMNNNKDCSDGVYFYVCTVYEETLLGTVGNVLKGTVTILR